jgi:nicotinamide mononucleotide (NMN) deamidase PncC
MVIQILPRDTRNAELAESFGSVGEGLGGALGLLIGSKMSQVRARNAFKGYGLDEKEADTLSRLPMEQRNKMLNNIAERKQFGQQGDQESAYNQQESPAQPFQMQPQTMPNMAARMIPQALQRQAGVTNPLQSAYQASQAPQNYEQALATGQPQAQLQAAQGGLRDLQRASLSGLLGNPQQSIQQQPQQAQRQPGQAPSLSATGGIAPALPSESTRAQPRALVDESGIPIQYQGMGLKPYKKPDRNTYAGIMSGPKYGEEDKREKDYYEHQLTAKENASKAEKPKLDKIYKEADVAAKELPFLEQLSELNMAGKIQYSALNKGNWLGQAASFIGMGERRGTEHAKELLAGLSKETKADLGVAGSAESRQKKLDKRIKDAQEALMRKDSLEQVIDENNGWVPRDIDKVVNQRAKLQARERQFNAPTKGQPLEEEPRKGSFIGEVTAPVVRAGEALAGLPGNLAALGAQGIKYATGADNAALNYVADNPLTSSSIRENVTKPLTGETFEPQSPASELYQDVVGTALSLVVPGGGLGGGLSKALTNTVKASAAVAGGKITGGALRAIGADPVSSALGEAVATGVFMGGQFKNKVEDAKKSLYKKADSIAESSKDVINTQGLRKKLNEVHNAVSSRDMQGKKFIQERLIGLEELANNPRATVRQTWNALKDLNSHWVDAPDGIIPYMKQLNESLNSELLNYGLKNDAWAQSFPKAQALASGLFKAERAAETVRNSKSLTSIPWVGKWINAGKGIAANTQELKTLANSSPQAQKMFQQFYARVLAQDIAGAANKARQLERIEREYQ